MISTYLNHRHRQTYVGATVVVSGMSRHRVVDKTDRQRGIMYYPRVATVVRADVCDLDCRHRQTYVAAAVVVGSSSLSKKRLSSKTTTC